ncbi:chalcone isomerase family protein [Pelomonas cellulosilytica]|uniref:Chalcone isomerase family protein n=1 Tax=Pelomonas cellulosilytica TaxID=2906762 RepID=A0ABS8XUN2_9BURK|nr:chalcone isomerase family protein [Pelomonas sp. P8]MCE4555380.1 chalcone isomerase family protein [Pelomonas sp. P8]
MRAFILAALLAATGLGGVALADTVEVANVKYETTAELAGQKLQLNGAGIRYKFVVKVYTAGLYLTARAGSTQEVLAARGPKRIQIHMLRDIDGNELGALFTKGIEANVSRDEFAKSINGVLKLSEVFASRKQLSSGDNFAVDYVPGVGSTLLVNGKSVLAEPIKEPEFFSALLRIWLGDKPADDSLKDALLGVKRERRR